jgi:hypothetical protein
MAALSVRNVFGKREDPESNDANGGLQGAEERLPRRFDSRHRFVYITRLDLM